MLDATLDYWVYTKFKKNLVTAIEKTKNWRDLGVTSDHTKLQTIASAMDMDVVIYVSNRREQAHTNAV